MITNPPLLQTYHLQIKVDSTLIQKGSIQEKKWKKKTSMICKFYFETHILFIVCLLNLPILAMSSSMMCNNRKI